ncbi:MAG: chorismate synthase, partial [Candidatus Thalassarchaeum sp.]|nr:chorismate synthase [Candidatus Thalassarchaeum sp.]
MGMTLGDRLRVTLFGESHGTCVGALVEGVPPGTLIDPVTLARNLASRKPGRKGLSTRSELDDCEILSGVYGGKATGWPILMMARNSDARSSDYEFLPDHPR